METEEGVAQPARDHEREDSRVWLAREEVRLMENVIAAATECDTWYRAGRSGAPVVPGAMLQSIDAAERLEEAVEALRKFRTAKAS